MSAAKNVVRFSASCALGSGLENRVKPKNGDVVTDLYLRTAADCKKDGYNSKSEESANKNTNLCAALLEARKLKSS